MRAGVGSARGGCVLRHAERAHTDDTGVPHDGHEHHQPRHHLPANGEQGSLVICTGLFLSESFRPLESARARVVDKFFRDAYYCFKIEVHTFNFSEKFLRLTSSAHHSKTRFTLLEPQSRSGDKLLGVGVKETNYLELELRRQITWN